MSALISSADWQWTALWWLIVWTLTATAAWSLAAVLSRCLRRHSAQARHRVWAMSMLLVLLAPLLVLPAERLLPTQRWWTLNKPGSPAPVATTGEMQAADLLPTPITISHAQDRHETLREHVHVAVDDRRHLARASAPEVADVARVESSSTVQQRAAQQNPVQPAPSRTPLPWLFWLIAAWLGGAAFGLLRLTVAAWRVGRLRRRSLAIVSSDAVQLIDELCRQLGISRTIKLLASSQTGVPLLAGLFNPAVVLPAGFGRWPGERLRMVLLHELVHLKRRDVFWEVAGQLALVPVWFHPLAWLAIKRLRVERELACDDAVLLSGAAATDYAEQLVQVAAELCHSAAVPATVVAMARASPIERRVRSILDQRVWRAPLGRWRTIGLSACMAGLIWVVAVLSPASGDEKAKSSPTVAKPQKTTAAAPAVVAPATTTTTVTTTATAPAGDDHGLAAALNRATTIHLQNVSLDDAFLALSESCGFPIAFVDQSFRFSGAEISAKVTVQANGQPLRDVLRALTQSAIHAAKIGISVVAKDGALRIRALEPTGKPKLLEAESRDGQAVYRLGTIVTAKGKPAANCSIVGRMRWESVFLHADAKGQVSIPLDNFGSLWAIVHSADGSEMAAEETSGGLRSPPFKVTLGSVKTVSVIVSDADGRPIPGAHVGAAEAANGFFRLSPPLFSGDTDDSGKFTLRLPGKGGDLAGHFNLFEDRMRSTEKFQLGYIYAFKSGAGLDYHCYAPVSGRADSRPTPAAQTPGVVRLTLAGAHNRVTVKCVDDSGKPIVGTIVSPRCFDFKKQGERDVLGPNPGFVVTDDRGEANFDWFSNWQDGVVNFIASPGDGRFNGEYAKFFPLKPSSQLTIAIHTNVQLSGTVRDAAGKPVADAQIELHGGGYASRFNDNTTSGAQGQYQFKVPPLQVYIVAANTADRRQASPVHAEVAVYPLRPVSGIDLTLAPTTRVFGRVAVGPENKPGGDYWFDISATDRTPRRWARELDFPHQPGERVAWPDISWNPRSDAQGKYEIRLAPGEYDFYADKGDKNHMIYWDQERHNNVKIGGAQFELNFHCKAPIKESVLHGTVNSGGKPVPGAIVEGVSQPHGGINAVANDRGAFEVSALNLPKVIFAKSKDGSLAGVVRVGTDQQNISIPIGPTATCIVRLLHKDKKPYSNQRTVDLHIRVPSDRKRPAYPWSGDAALA